MTLQDQVAALTAQFAQQQKAVDRMAQDVHRHEQQLGPVRSAPLVNRKTGDQLYGPKAMQKHLSVSGIAPLHLGGLRGSAGETEPANIPEVQALPQLGDTSIKSGTVVHHQGVNYRRDKTGWSPLTK